MSTLSCRPVPSGVLVILILWFGVASVNRSSLAQEISPESSTPISKIAFGSCAKQTKKQPIWEAIVGKSPDLFLFIGDTVYADTHNPDELKAALKELGNQPGYQKLKKTCPVFAIWDDHDFGLNDGGAEHPNKAEAQQVFLDFYEVAKDSSVREREGIYQAYEFGPQDKRVQVLLLDTRYHRGPLSSIKLRGAAIYLPRSDRTVTMLGEAQWKWLKAQLQKPAKLRILASSIQVLPNEHLFEKWHNLPHERERLLELLKETTGATVLISGDQHLGEITRIRLEDRDLYEVTSSGMTHTRGGIPAPNSHRLGEKVLVNNFGLISIDWSAKEPQVTLAVHDESGEEQLSEEVPLAEIFKP